MSHVSMTVISNEVCDVAYLGNIHYSNLCTNTLGGSGPCKGDTGGPLVVMRNGNPMLVYKPPYLCHQSNCSYLSYVINQSIFNFYRLVCHRTISPSAVSSVGQPSSPESQPSSTLLTLINFYINIISY